MSKVCGYKMHNVEPSTTVLVGRVWRHGTTKGGLEVQSVTLSKLKTSVMASTSCLLSRHSIHLNRYNAHLDPSPQSCSFATGAQSGSGLDVSSCL